MVLLSVSLLFLLLLLLYCCCCRCGSVAVVLLLVVVDAISVCPSRGPCRGSTQAGDLLGAMWHFLGQGAFIRLVAASGRVVNLNVLEANGVLLGLSHLGNGVAGSRLRRITGVAGGAVAAATGEVRRRISVRSALPYIFISIGAHYYSFFPPMSWFLCVRTTPHGSIVLLFSTRRSDKNEELLPCS